MSRRVPFVFSIAVSLVVAISSARAAEQGETFGDKLKKLFVHATPTPKRRAKGKTSATPTPVESATVTPTPTAESGGSTSLPIEAQRTEPQGAQPQYFEPVRPISPGPGSRRRASPKNIATPEMTAVPMAAETATATAAEMESATPTPSPVLTPLPTETPQMRPMPSLPQIISPSELASPPSTPGAEQSRIFLKKIGTPAPRSMRVPMTSIEQISESASYSPELRKIVERALDLTSRNLSYKYASADPAKGGMDCSGFIYYVLSESGMENVPRDARDQYIWVRKAGTFQAVLAQRDDTFELDGLKPGDLLFWASNYGISADPDITQTMIYLGRDKTTKQRLMIGASETSSFKNKSRSGVGVFDFKIGRAAPKSNNESGPVFVGYGHIPVGQ